MIGETLMILGGIATLFSISGRSDARKRSPQTVNWPIAMGIVTVSEKVRGNEHIGQSDTTKFSYEYRVGEQSFHGNKITLLDHSSDLKWLFIRYPVGKQIVVFYNPDMPSEAIIKPGSEHEFFGRGRVGSALFGVSQMCLAVFGFGIIYAGISSLW
jgi:Protein of unknown function (DUF3592)